MMHGTVETEELDCSDALMHGTVETEELDSSDTWDRS